MRPFQELVVWQKAHALALDVYRATRGYPRDERFGVTAQTRQAAASAPANIAEGCGLRSRAPLRRSVHLAAGSLSELDYWLIFARDLGYLPPAAYEARRKELIEVRRLLLGFAAWCARPRPHPALPPPARRPDPTPDETPARLRGIKAAAPDAARPSTPAERRPRPGCPQDSEVGR